MGVRVSPPPHPPPRVLAEFVEGVSRVWPSWKTFLKVSALVQILFFCSPGSWMGSPGCGLSLEEILESLCPVTETLEGSWHSTCPRENHCIVVFENFLLYFFKKKWIYSFLYTHTNLSIRVATAAIHLTRHRQQQRVLSSTRHTHHLKVHV